MSPEPSVTKFGMSFIHLRRQRGTSIGVCEGGEAGHHAATTPHPKGEWIIVEVRVQTPLLAQYAVAHYLEQDRVLDADVLD
jgi:hypothetical protein